MGDAKLLRQLLDRVPSRQYGLGEAWVMGRLTGASDSLQARFLATDDRELKVCFSPCSAFSAEATIFWPTTARQ